MKGFIEVVSQDSGSRFLIPIRKINSAHDPEDKTRGNCVIHTRAWGSLRIKDLYEDVKRQIEQKEPDHA